MAPSIDRKSQSMPTSSSYSSTPLWKKRAKVPSFTHSRKRSLAVEEGQRSVSLSAFHWQPVRIRKKMPSRQPRSSARGRPPPKRWVFTRGGMQTRNFSHNSSDTRKRDLLMVRPCTGGIACGSIG